MDSFDKIYAKAVARHGVGPVLDEKIQENSGPIDPPAMSDSEWLAQFTKRTFQAGFKWSLIEDKWPAFEKAFWNFDVDKCAAIGMDEMEALTSNKDIVRNPKKLRAVAMNAEMIKTMAKEKGSADAFIRGWPSEDYFGLLDYLNRNGAQLGTNTASYALRASGVPSVILSRDVIRALIEAGVVDKPPKSKSALKTVQDAFNQWGRESGKSLTYISRVLALSTDG